VVGGLLGTGLIVGGFIAIVSSISIDVGNISRKSKDKKRRDINYVFVEYTI
jgi:hypothetical protein